MQEVTYKDINPKEVITALKEYQGGDRILNKMRAHCKRVKKITPAQVLMASKALNTPSFQNAVKNKIYDILDADLRQIYCFVAFNNHTLPFLLSLKKQVLQGKPLTEKQFIGASKWMNRGDKDYTFRPSELTITPVDIVISTGAARRIKKSNDFEFAPTTITITKFHGQTNKAILVSGTLTEGHAGVCKCCGSTLTGEISKATGLGPVCSEKLSIRYIKNISELAVYKKRLQRRINEIGELKFWVPKSQIINGKSDLKESIQKVRNELNTDIV